MIRTRLTDEPDGRKNIIIGFAKHDIVRLALTHKPIAFDLDDLEIPGVNILIVARDSEDEMIRLIEQGLNAEALVIDKSYKDATVADLADKVLNDPLLRAAVNASVRSGEELTAARNAEPSGNRAERRGTKRNLGNKPYRKR